MHLKTIRDTAGCIEYDLSQEEKRVETSRFYIIVQINVIFVKNDGGPKKVAFGGWGDGGLRSNYISAVGIQVFQDVHRRFISSFLKTQKPQFHVCAQGNTIPHIFCHYRTGLKPSPFPLDASISLSLTPSGRFRKRMLPDLTSFLFQLCTVRWFGKKKKKEEKNKRKKPRYEAERRVWIRKTMAQRKFPNLMDRRTSWKRKWLWSFQSFVIISCISWSYKNVICSLIPPQIMITVFLMDCGGNLAYLHDLHCV